MSIHSCIQELQKVLGNIESINNFAIIFLNCYSVILTQFVFTFDGNGVFFIQHYMFFFKVACFHVII